MANQERARGGISPAVVRKPVEVEEPQLPRRTLEPLPEPPEKIRRKKGPSIKARVAGVGLALALAAAGVGAAVAIPKFLNRDSGQTETISRTTGLGPSESVSWWQELPTEQIQKLAEVPSII